MKKFVIFLVLVLTTQLITAQVLTQTVRGKVIDEDSKSPLIGVNVQLTDGVSVYGSSTDVDGNFKISNVPVGRYKMEISYLGYEPRVIPILDVDAGKEKVMTITLTETFQNLEEFTVTAEKEKHKAMNEMALVSARSFSVEETKRYAGTANDPARMASSYAGVSNRGGAGDNEIIIRGNSPRGLLWRINGIEVPNPNHFATEGAGGGGISIINSNVLDNSDFYTGAYPAEYGNAFSGIFDINFRKGNNEKYEYAIKGGFLGSDISVEGPISRSLGSSFLVNYRYSTLGILQDLKLLDFESTTTFQDLTYNVNLPTEKMGTFTMFGLFSHSSYDEKVDFITNDTTTGSDGTQKIEEITVQDNEGGSYGMGALGFTNTYFLNDKTYLHSYIAMDQTAYRENEKGLDPSTLKTYPDEKATIINNSARASVSINRKINSRNNIRAGIIHNALFYDMRLSEADSVGPLVTKLDQNGNTSYSQAYVSWKYKILQNLVLTSGVHVSYFALNEELLAEPRMAIKWQYNPRQSLSFGFGMHSRHESLSAYFGQTVNATGKVVTPNTDLEQTKAIHYVLGYDNKLTDQLYFKAEWYYQDLYDVGVEANVRSPYSMLNQDNSFTTRELSGRGTGQNYGMELTLEKYFSNTYYFLLTASLYESTYKGSDGASHNTRYNGNQLVNLAFGKEFKIGKPLKERTLVMNTRTTVAGNNRYTPIDLERSRVAGETVYQENRQYDRKMDTYTRMDFSIALIRQKKKSTREWKIDILNVLNLEYVDEVFYSSKTGMIEKGKDGQMIPILSYQVKF